MGCGATRDGYGLYSTTNAGRSWQKVGGVVESMRVTSISRAPGGRLFVGGTGNAGLRIATVSGSGSKAFYSKPEEKAQSRQTYQVGSFQIDDKGRAVSESLTGCDVMFWPTPAARIRLSRATFRGQNCSSARSGSTRCAAPAAAGASGYAPCCSRSLGAPHRVVASCSGCWVLLPSNRDWTSACEPERKRALRRRSSGRERLQRIASSRSAVTAARGAWKRPLRVR